MVLTRPSVRPAPALVQKLLVGAFGWMFAGLLLTAGIGPIDALILAARLGPNRRL